MLEPLNNYQKISPLILCLSRFFILVHRPTFERLNLGVLFRKLDFFRCNFPKNANLVFTEVLSS